MIRSKTICQLLDVNDRTFDVPSLGFIPDEIDIELTVYPTGAGAFQANGADIVRANTLVEAHSTAFGSDTGCLAFCSGDNAYTPTVTHLNLSRSAFTGQHSIIFLAVTDGNNPLTAGSALLRMTFKRYKDTAYV